MDRSQFIVLFDSGINNRLKFRIINDFNYSIGLRLKLTTFSSSQLACFHKLIVKWVDQVLDIFWLKISPNAPPNAAAAADFIFAPPTPSFWVGAPPPPTLNLRRAAADQMMPAQCSRCGSSWSDTHYHSLQPQVTGPPLRLRNMVWILTGCEGTQK